MNVNREYTTLTNESSGNSEEQTECDRLDDEVSKSEHEGSKDSLNKEKDKSKVKNNRRKEKKSVNNKTE